MIVWSAALACAICFAFCYPRLVANWVMTHSADFSRRLKGPCQQILVLLMANALGERCRCKDLPNGVDWDVMDACVNHGTGRAAKFLQKAVMVNQDGAIGPLTLMAVGEANPEEIINRLTVYRDVFYCSLSTFETFGRGWIRRNDETREQALEMARG